MFKFDNKNASSIEQVKNFQIALPSLVLEGFLTLWRKLKRTGFRVTSLQVTPTLFLAFATQNSSILQWSRKFKTQ